MGYRILMLGGKRAGKSTILATILYALESIDLMGCQFKDTSIYPMYSTDMNGKIQLDSEGRPITIKKLNKKRIEIDEYLRRRTIYGTNAKFLVDLNSSTGKGEYQIRSSKGKLDFSFVDIPGEWMDSDNTEYKALKTLISETDVFIIAIDTPYIMDNINGDYNRNLNDIYNRIDEISNALQSIKIEDEIIDKKQFLLCPVKCEKWINNGEVDKVVQRIKLAYNDLINTWKDRVDIWILPIQTAGGIQSYRLLPAMKSYNTSDQKVGDQCSVEGPLVLYKDGGTIRKEKVARIEEDGAQVIDSVKIPFSWYETNERGFAPKNCEQVMFHLLRFLVKRELNYNQVKAKSWEQLSFVKRMIFTLIGKRMPFGKNIYYYSEMIRNLEENNKILINQDGFVNLN